MTKALSVILACLCVSVFGAAAIPEAKPVTMEGLPFMDVLAEREQKGIRDVVGAQPSPFDLVSRCISRATGRT